MKEDPAPSPRRTAVRERSRHPAFGVGSVLGRSFPIWFRNFVPFTVLSLIVYSPYLVFTYLVSDDPTAAEKYRLVEDIVPQLLPIIVTGAIIYGVFQHLRGQPTGMGASIAVGIRRLLPVLGTSILVTVIVAAPSMLGQSLGGAAALLSIFSIIFMCMFWVAVPAAVIERTGVLASLGRSKQLTEGAKGKVFLIMLIVGLIQVGVVLGADALWTKTTEPSDQPVLWVLVGTWVLTSALGALEAVTTAVGYHDLRVSKEGIGIEEMVKVFD